MAATFLWFNLFASAGFVLFAYLSARRNSTYFTSLTSSIYVLTNGLFILYSADTALEYGYLVGEMAQLKAAAANLLFMIIVVAGLILSRGVTVGRDGRLIAPPIPSVGCPSDKWIIVVSVMIILFEMRYLFGGGGIQRALSLAFVDGRESLYNLRYDEALAIESGSGLFTSLLSMRIVFPVLCLAIFYKLLSLKLRSFSSVLGLLILISINYLVGLSTLQRSPVFNITLVILVALFWASSIGKAGELGDASPVAVSRFAFGKWVGVVLCGSLAGAGIYSFTERVDIFEGFYRIFERIFLIASFSSTSYYELFGQDRALGFAGWSQLFGYPVESNGSEITYRDVGEAANGWPHNLNASFVATAFGASGFLGVLAISAIFTLIGCVVDTMFRGTSVALRRAILVLGVFPAFELANGPFSNAVFAGFGLSPILLYMFFRGVLSENYLSTSAK